MNTKEISELNIPTCPRCGSRIRPEKKGDFFGYCSWDCLKGFKNEFEAKQTDGPKSGLFGKRGIL